MGGWEGWRVARMINHGSLLPLQYMLSFLRCAAVRAGL